MKKIFIVLAVILVGFSCKKAKTTTCDEPELNCGDILCLLHNYNFDFRIVDKTTGADLVFGTNPRYTTNDVALYYDAAATMPIHIFSNLSANYFHVMTAREQMFLVIAGGTAYKLEVKFKGSGCCDSRVKTLKAAGQSICACCDDIIAVPVN